MAATGSGLVGCLLLMLSRGVFSMSNCNTESAICAFNGRLQGTILFQEKHGFGCSSFGDADGLHVQIDLQGFDPQDRVTAHNFRIKSFAGLMPNCTGMGPDHGQGLRGADLGTYPESKGGVVQISDARLKNGPSLSGAQSIVGRSVAVLKGQDPQARFQSRQVTLGCCIIGVADLQGLAAGNSFGASNTFNPQPSNTNSFNQPGNNFSPPANTFNPPANTFNPQGSNFNQPGNNFSPPANTFNPPRTNFNQPGNTFNTNPTGGFNNGASGGGFNNGGRPAAGGRGGGGGFNSFNSQPPASSTYGPFASSAIRRQSAATRPSPQELSGSFTNSAFKSPFALGDRFSFFDLSVPTGIQNGPFGGFSDSGSAFSSPFKSPSASSPGFFDLGSKNDVYSPSTTNFVSGPQQPNLNNNNLNNNNLNNNNLNNNINNVNNVNNPVSPQPIPTAPIGNTSQQQGQGLGQGQGQGQVQGQVTPQPGPNPIGNQNQYPDNQNRYPTSQTQYPPSQNQLPNNQNQYPPNQNQYPQNQNQVTPTQNRFPGVSQPPPNQGDQLLEGFSSFPVQASIFQNPLGGPSNGVGTIQGAKAQLGDLFFQGSDKNPAADLLGTGLFGSKEYGAGNGQYNPYEDFVEANNNQQPAQAPSNYDNGGNSNNYDDYGGDYQDRDYRGGDGGAGGGGGGGNPDYGAEGNNYDYYDGQDYKDRGSPSSQGGGGPPYDSYPAGDFADYPSQGDSRDYPSGSRDYPSGSRDYPSDSGGDYPTDSRDYPAGNGGDNLSGGNYPIEYPDKGDYPGNRDYSSNGDDYPVSSSYDSDPRPSPYDVKETPQTEPAKTGAGYGPGGGSDSSQPYNGILPGEPTDGQNLPEDDAGDKKAVTYYVNPTTQSVSTNLPVDPNSIPLLDSGAIPTPAGSLGSDNLGPSPSYSTDPSEGLSNPSASDASQDPSYPSQDPSYPSQDPSYPSTPQPDSTYDELPPTGFSDLGPYAYEGGFVPGISAVGDRGSNRAPTVAGTTSSPVAAFDTPQPIALPPELQRR